MAENQVMRLQQLVSDFKLNQSMKRMKSKKQSLLNKKKVNQADPTKQPQKQVKQKRQKQKQTLASTDSIRNSSTDSQSESDDQLSEISVESEDSASQDGSHSSESEWSEPEPDHDHDNAYDSDQANLTPTSKSQQQDKQFFSALDNIMNSSRQHYIPSKMKLKSQMYVGTQRHYVHKRHALYQSFLYRGKLTRGEKTRRKDRMLVQDKTSMGEMVQKFVGQRQAEAEKFDQAQPMKENTHRLPPRPKNVSFLRRNNLTRRTNQVTPRKDFKNADSSPPKQSARQTSANVLVQNQRPPVHTSGILNIKQEQSGSSLIIQIATKHSNEKLPLLCEDANPPNVNHNTPLMNLSGSASFHCKSQSVIALPDPYNQLKNSNNLPVKLKNFSMLNHSSSVQRLPDPGKQILNVKQQAQLRAAKQRNNRSSAHRNSCSTLSQGLQVNKIQVTAPVGELHQAPKQRFKKRSVENKNLFMVQQLGINAKTQQQSRRYFN